MPNTARYRLLNLVLVALLFAGSVWAYPRLPARIPMHFGVGGRPDRWEGRSLASWFLLPLITAALALFMRWIAGVGARHPHTWNVPDKPRFLALTPEARAPIVAKLQEFVALVSVVVTMLMGAVQAGIYQAAMGNEAAVAVWIMGAVGVSLVLMAVLGVRLNASVSRMIRDASAPAGD